MAQSPILSPNSSSVYHPAQTQMPKSLVFSSLFLTLPSSKQNELNKITGFRDEFYRNHISVKQDKMHKFVMECTKKAAKPEDGKAIACALLTIREQSTLQALFDFIFVQQKPHEFNVVIDNIWITLYDSIRKSFPFLSSNASHNALNILTLLCEKTENIQRITELSNFLISSIDAGCISQLNLLLVEYFAQHTQKFKQIWPKLEHVIVNLLIKFLRFYQDIYTITVEPTEKTKLAINKSSSAQPRTISSSTSALPTFNDSSTKVNMSLLQKALNIGTSFESAFPTFFNIGITSNTIAKYGFKEIDRILHDPKTFQKMNNKFPIIYKQLNSIPDNFICCFTNCTISQVMLPYQHLKEMLSYVNYFTQKSEIDFPPFLKRNNTKLIDIDLILSDAIRTYLQSVDYDRNSYELRFSFILNILHKGIERGVKLSSSLHALVSDFFFIIGDLNENPESQRKTLLLVSPAMSLIEDPKMEKLASTLIEIILMRLKQHDFGPIKTNSVRSLLRFMNEKRGINIFERVNSIKYLNEKQKEEFRGLIVTQESNIIPQQVTDFTKRNLPLDSQNGIDAIVAANDKIRSFYVQNGNNWAPAVQNIKRIFDVLVPSSRKGIDTVLEKIDIHATTPCMCYNLHDAQILLKFVNEHKLFDEFEEALHYTDQKFFGDALVQEISTNIHSTRYRQFLISCKTFRKNIELLKTICDYCQMNFIVELAELPYLDVGQEAELNHLSRILSICSLWSNDLQTKLTFLLNGLIATPADLIGISDVIIKTFDKLPPVIVQFFQNMMMMRINPSYAQIIQKLQKLNSDKAQQFCCLVLGRWNLKKSINPQLSRSSLVQDVIL